MLIFPAIDLYEGKAVRLFKGDYAQMTVYSETPELLGPEFAKCGAKYIHIVDLEGAKAGETSNFDTVVRIKKESGLYCEIGGGIRDMATIEKYLCAGIDRVILGTAAVTKAGFAKEAAANFGKGIAVGVDIKDSKVAIKGWLEKSALDAFDFCKQMQDAGVRTIICTDISKDGAMSGTNLELYREMSRKFDIQITASGGISTLEDVRALADMNIYGAIIGKAYYTGAIALDEAVKIGGQQI